MRAAQGRTAAAPAPAPDDDRGHSHDHGHSHGHSHDHASDPAPAGPPVRVTAEGTPNPSAMKFTVNRTVREAGSLSLNSAAEAKGDALGAALFAVEGVRSIFAVNDFVTVTREAEADWSALAPAVEAALTQHFSA
jgi:hypothetical protein